MVRKAAFTLIELIFAIVIIAITVISLPMMKQVIFKGIENNIIQEAIFASATVLNEVTTAHWDDNSFGPSDTFAKVIDLGNCENNSSLVNYRYMPGHIIQPLHRKCLDNNSTAPADADISATVSSLNDFVPGPPNLFNSFVTDAQGYKHSYNSVLSVTRPANFNGNNPNIKRINITISDTSTGKILTSLSTYSANIGEIDYYKKGY